MGTAKNKDFCNVFILKKHSFKKQIYTCELVHNWKWARQTFQCIFDTVAIYLTVLEKEQHKKKIYI